MKKSQISLPRKQYEQFNDQLLKYFLENYNNSGKGIDFIYDLNLNRCFHFSSNFKKLTGNSNPDTINDYFSYAKSIIHPDDYSPFILDFIEFIRLKRSILPESQDDFIKSFELSMQTPQGLWMNVNLHFLIQLPDKVFGIIRKKDSPDFKKSSYHDLSKREIEILNHLANGESAKIIGNKLNISETTVITHRKNLKQKFEVKNTAELIKVAAKARII